MWYSIGKVAALCGVSVRTLHYYDEIGLLHPPHSSEAGYRLYDAESLAQLQQILFYREIGFPLKEIPALLHCSKEEQCQALQKHRSLLQLKRARLDELLRLVEATIGGEHMKMPSVTERMIAEKKKEFAEEVRRRWGDTKAFQQQEEKEKGQTGQQEKARLEDTNEIFAAFAALRHLPPEGQEAQAQVAHWQRFLTAHYYDCDRTTLAGLGELYQEDERFRSYLDAFGDGTAAFMQRAIQIYCAE